MPSLFFNHPLQIEELNCPLDGSVLVDSSLWTDSSLQKYNPRLIFNLFRNTLLVSKVYKCDGCDREFLAHDRALQWQLQRAKLQFLLMKRSGVTGDLYSYVVNVATTTGTFNIIESIIG